MQAPEKFGAFLFEGTMKNKIKINEDNYKEVVLKRAIIICWILLLACFAIKILGGNYFAIACTNEKFVRVCEYIETSVVRYIESYISFIISSVILLLSIRDNKRLFNVNTFVFIITISLWWGFKLLIDLKILTVNTLLYNILDIVVLYLVLCIFSKKPVKSIFAVVLMFIFTIISAFTKNIGLHENIMSDYVVANIFLIDYYIMLVLTLLYSIKIKRRKL